MNSAPVVPMGWCVPEVAACLGLGVTTGQTDITQKMGIEVRQGPTFTHDPDPGPDCRQQPSCRLASDGIKGIQSTDHGVSPSTILMQA